MNALRKAVFLDRDGVLNRAFVRDGRPYSPRTLNEVEVLPGVADACAALRASGYLLVMVTNQPDVARGATSRQNVEAINHHLSDQLGLDDCEVCVHDDADNCDCRKPKPGLLTRSAERLGIDLRSSFVVGDRWRDVEAGRSAGCRTIFIDRAYRERRPESPDHVSLSLRRATEWILSEGEVMNQRFNLKVKLFADGADTASILALARDSRIQGFTTNPTLMRKAGITDYEKFARELVSAIPDRPISFEVFSDDLHEMRQQALHMSSWGGNVYVKVPVTNTRRESTDAILRSLASDGVKLNVTALMTLAQVERVAEAVERGPSSFISVFAGRIADTGRDPVPVMTAAAELLCGFPRAELIWASPREVLNVIQANVCGCDIITLTPELLKKMSTFGKDLDQFSLETVKMFYDDAHAAGYTLDVSATSDVLNLARALGASESPQLQTEEPERKNMASFVEVRKNKETRPA